MLQERPVFLPEGGTIIRPGELLIIDPPLAGCFISAIQYVDIATVTHFGPSQNELSIAFHRSYAHSLMLPTRIYLCSLDLQQTYFWEKRQEEYNILRGDLLRKLFELGNSNTEVELFFYLPNIPLYIEWLINNKLFISQSKDVVTA